MESHSDGLHETAQMQIAIRVPASVTVAELERRVAALAGEGNLTFSSREDAIRTDKNNALVRSLLTAIRHEGGSPGFSVKTGTADMNVVGPVWGCPILAYGPGDSTLDHTPHEHVEIAELERAVAVLKHAIRDFTSP